METFFSRVGSVVLIFHPINSLAGLKLMVEQEVDHLYGSLCVLIALWVVRAGCAVLEVKLPRTLLELRT